VTPNPKDSFDAYDIPQSSSDAARRTAEHVANHPEFIGLAAHDATIDPIDVQLLGRCEDEVCRQGDARHALRRERDWYRDAWLREQAEAEKWHARHGSVCWFSIFAVSAVVWLLAPHLWDAAVWIWRWP
jgi:hypothetical protein